MKLSITIITLFLLTSCQYKSKCIRCIDGDTIVIADGTHIRLAEIDAIELAQPFGYEAKNYISSLILDKEITIRRTDTDKYGREVAEIYCAGEWINEKMVTAGYAYTYKRFASTKLYNEELQAKADKIGIWATYSVPPYIWRRKHKKY